MQIEIRQGFLVDALEEPQEFPLPVSGHAFADDRAVKHIQGCEQRGCAMALVVVGHRTGTPLLHRQARLGTIESLDLATARPSTWMRSCSPPALASRVPPGCNGADPCPMCLF